jgi:hypothetical protein
MALIEGQKRSKGPAAPSPVDAMPELAAIAQSAQKYEPGVDCAPPARRCRDR